MKPRDSHLLVLGWPGARLLVGHGPDGADLALLRSVGDVTAIAERFAKVKTSDSIMAQEAFKMME